MRDWCIIYIGIIKIPLFKDVLVKNPSNCRLESFINPGIVMIAVIEVPIIEDLLYFLHVLILLSKEIVFIAEFTE